MIHFSEISLKSLLFLSSSLNWSFIPEIFCEKNFNKIWEKITEKMAFSDVLNMEGKGEGKEKVREGDGQRNSVV